MNVSPGQIISPNHYRYCGGGLTSRWTGSFDATEASPSPMLRKCIPDLARHALVEHGEAVGVPSDEPIASTSEPTAHWRHRIWGSAFVLMMGGRIVGAALSPMFLAHAPLALLVLSPVIGHLVIVAALSEPIGYYCVAIGVSVLHCLLGFVLGRLQGPWIIQFLVRRGVASEPRLQRMLAPLRVSAPLLVFAIPGPIVCALAGASAVSRRTFLPALVGSQATWAVLCRLFGQALLGWIAVMRETIARNAIALTLVTTAIVAFIHFRRSRSSKTS